MVASCLNLNQVPRLSKSYNECDRLVGLFGELYQLVLSLFTTSGMWDSLDALQTEYLIVVRCTERCTLWLARSKVLVA